MVDEARGWTEMDLEERFKHDVVKPANEKPRKERKVEEFRS